MKKNKLLLLLTLIIFVLHSCTKVDVVSGDFNKLIGTWKSTNTDEPIILEIKNNGKIEFSRSVERSRTLKFDLVEMRQFTQPNIFYREIRLFRYSKEVILFYSTEDFSTISPRYFNLPLIENDTIYENDPNHHINFSKI